MNLRKKSLQDMKQQGATWLNFYVISTAEVPVITLRTTVGWQVNKPYLIFWIAMRHCDKLSS